MRRVKNSDVTDNNNVSYDADYLDYETVRGEDTLENIENAGNIANDEAGYEASHEPDFEAGDYECEDGDYAYEPDGLFSTPGRVIALVSLVLMLFVVAGLAAWLLGKSTSTASSGPPPIPAGVQTGVRVGALPPDFELNDANTGKPVKLSSLRGNPVWVNFWASWCAPCRAEMPEMKQRYAKYKDKGLVILGVDLGEDSATVNQFTQLNGYDWTFVLDSNQQVSQQYFVSGIPTHLFLDKAGVIRAMTVGGISGDMMNDSLTKIIGQ